MPVPDDQSEVQDVIGSALPWTTAPVLGAFSPDGSARCRRADVLRYLGHSGQPITEDLQQRIEDGIVRCETMLTPQYIWQAYGLIAPVDRSGCYRVADTTLVFEGDDIFAYLAGADGVVLLAATLGAESERTLQILGRTDALDQLIYDAACNDLIEWCADEVCAEIARDAAEHGRMCAQRYSPGYGDFDLAIQPRFLEVLQTPKRLGLTISDGGLLIPTKSITAMIGLFSGAPNHAKLGCETCNLRDTCQLRARGMHCYRHDETV